MESGNKIKIMVVIRNRKISTRVCEGKLIVPAMF